MSDTGSLFGWTDPKREQVRKQAVHMQQVVRLVRLSDILRHVHPPGTFFLFIMRVLDCFLEPPLFLWDTLKIDIQGADVDALISAGNFVKNFLCIVGRSSLMFPRCELLCLT